MVENNSKVIDAGQSTVGLSDFIESKKRKKEPSKADGQEFERLWLELAEEIGINDVSISLLCEGFRFCAARPLFDYCKKNVASTIPYTTLGSFSAIKANNQEIALRMFMSLLALEIVNPTSAEQIAWLIKRIPDAALNKEGKTSGNMSGFVRKLIVQEVSGNEIMAAGVREELKANEAARFARLIIPILKDLNERAKLSAAEQNAVSALTEWVSALHETETPKDPTPVDYAAESPARHDAATPADSAPSSDGINAAQVVAFIQRQERRVELLRSNNSSAEAEIGRLKEDKKLMRERNASLEERLERAREGISAANARIAELEGQLSKASADLAAHQELVDMLDKDMAKQSDETMTRIARKLKIEYQDYQDAVGMEMDVVLGENMRLQLGEVFKILKENGFEL